MFALVRYCGGLTKRYHLNVCQLRYLTIIWKLKLYFKVSGSRCYSHQDKTTKNVTVAPRQELLRLGVQLTPLEILEVLWV